MPINVFHTYSDSLTKLIKPETFPFFINITKISGIWMWNFIHGCWIGCGISCRDVLVCAVSLIEGVKFAKLCMCTCTDVTHFFYSTNHHRRCQNTRIAFPCNSNCGLYRFLHNTWALHYWFPEVFSFSMVLLVARNFLHTRIIIQITDCLVCISSLWHCSLTKLLICWKFNSLLSFYICPVSC
jgi:hypothetical protein